MKTEDNIQCAKGDKVRFMYSDCDDIFKDIYGVGKVKEIEPETNRIWVQTTRKLHWMEPAAITLNLTNNYKK